MNSSSPCHPLLLPCLASLYFLPPPAYFSIVLSSLLLSLLLASTCYIYIQVTIKPLTRQGLNTSILACLRDARHLHFDDSLIGAIETSLCNEPVYFDGYLDLIISLTDKNILETLKINIKFHGYNMLPGSEIIAIIHHVHYKATNSICPKSLVNLLKGETTIMKCITNDSNILIPQKIKWNDINIPEYWCIQSDTIAPNQENIENTSLHSITQNEE
ncbi:MP domain-containing protein [Cephalotus follicularis]|uniref:MP domain-containing protein n=1 Tax=Cephalotus follicularis TaxID=3775 RepID=A0A1Q3DGW1_CEPFO|nr:MP domain-containing protein [Cephalotus follicularis]